MQIPEGWDPKLFDHQHEILKTLGIPLGTNKQINQHWEAHQTQKIQHRIDRQISRNLPKTQFGRILALKNGIYAVSCYMLENQKPTKIDALISKW